MRAWKTTTWPSIIFLVCIYVCVASGLSSQTARVRLARRQVAPAAPPQPPPPNPLPPMTSANPAPAPPTQTAGPPGTPGAPNIPTTASDTTAQETLPPTSAPTSASSTASSTSSVIHITALPPAPSGQSTRQKHSSLSSFNFKYLAPLFAALGIALGAFSAWLLLVCRSRCRDRRPPSDLLEPGPEYRGPPDAEKSKRAADGRTFRTNPWSTFLGGRRRPSHRDTTTPDYSNPTWLSRMFTTRQRPQGPGYGYDRHDPRVMARAIYTDDSYSFLEDDPFLSQTPSATTGTSGTSDPLGRSQDILTTSFISVGVAPSDADGWSQGPENSMRQDGVRGEVLGRVKPGPKPRRGHAKADSDGNILGASPAPYPSNPSLLCPTEGTRSGHSGTSGTTANSSEPLMPGAYGQPPGFRIVDEEAVEVVRAQKPGWTWTLPWVAAEQVNTDDRFTVMPSRNVADKRKTPMVSPAPVATPSTSPPGNYQLSPGLRGVLPRADSSVLPASPPLLSSPPIDAQLFFSPIFGSTPSLTLAQDRVQSNHSAQSRQPSERAPSRLPFLAADVQKSTPYRHRLTKSPPTRPETAPPQASPRPHTIMRSPTSVSTSSTGSGSRQVALDRVGEILAKSWSQREMDGVASPVSPTMFGAQVERASPRVVVESPDVMQGIEERLAQA